MLSPLLNMVALTIVFSAILRQQIANYPVYYMAGSLVFAFFSQATAHAASLTLDAIEMSKRVYLPRSVFVATAVGVAMVNLVLSLVPFLLIVLVTRFPIHVTWLFLPVSIVVAALFTAGVGLLVFTMSCRFVDVRETYLVLLTPLFFLTPVVYTPAIVPPAYRFILTVNPLLYIVEVFRRPLYDGQLPDARTFALALGISVTTLAAGWIFYSAKIEEYGTRG